MALVHAILCHRSPRYVAELVRALWHQDHHILLHADAKAPAELHATCALLAEAFATVHVVPSLLCSWGGWSLVEAMLRALDMALALPTPWRHFVLLSEHHVPLQPPATMAASLPDGVSFADAMPFAAMDRDQRADVLHRVTRHWRELPGVGMFALGPRELDTGERQALRLGSQWVVLARAACERLAAGRAALLPFRDSLVPDETALTSVLLGGGLGRGLEVRKESKTFVAWPHLGGDADSQFGDAAVRDARARGYLFIRKRPPILPRAAVALLATMRGRPDLPSLPPEPGLGVADDAAAARLVDAVGALLRRRIPGLDLRTAPPGVGPALFVHVRAPSLAPELAVLLVSQDMAAFKVVLAWLRPFDGALGPIRLAGHATTVMGARLPGLTLAREVHLDLPDHGFLLHPSAAALADALLAALATAQALAPLVPARAA